MATEVLEKQAEEVPASIIEELEDYRAWIEKFQAGKVGEIKMQKIRLQLGTYAQRQEGVQMNRIKFPGGTLSSRQMRGLADAADKYGSGFIHFTTREDAQIYYLKLNECPDMMIDLAKAGITTREACGNTVRNITACYRSGVSATQVFDVIPYAQALFEFLVRNKYNQVMGRKFKIAFESCHDDHSGLLYHDFGFQSVIREENGKQQRGFRTYMAGGLGAVPILGFLYSEFLPVEELLNYAAATVRVFDRFGERKNRMQARMKYLAKKLGPEELKTEIDKERKVIVVPAADQAFLQTALEPVVIPEAQDNLPVNPELDRQDNYQAFVRDNVMDHYYEGFKGVNVRLKLGDILTGNARQLAEISDTFSSGEMRISIEQNIFLPWVPENALPALYSALEKAGLADAGAETITDTTTCPGADTCRLGITSARGLGARISEIIEGGNGQLKELSKDVRIKISGCPNSCAQHMVAHIAFQGAASKKDGKSVPSHFLYLGGQQMQDETRLAVRIGKYPAYRCPDIVGRLLELYGQEKSNGEVFNDTMVRVGKDRVKEALKEFFEVPSFEENEDYYQDWGHENEGFAVRQGIKGECAGAPVQENAPTMVDAEEKMAQAKAFLKHKEYANAQIEAFEAAAAAARVPVYTHLCDPFTSEQALWEFENIFVRAGKSDDAWLDSTNRFVEGRDAEASEDRAKAFIETVKEYMAECDRVNSDLLAVSESKK